MMNPNDIKYTINDLCLKTSRMLRIPAPKIIYNIQDDIVTNEFGVNEIYIDDRATEDVENIFLLLQNLFTAIYDIYQQNVVKNFQMLEDTQIVRLWKNELIRQFMYSSSEDFDIFISRKAFSIFMIEKVFGVHQKIKDDKIEKRYREFLSKYPTF